MIFNISKWKEGDDPQLIIDFITEVFTDLLPSYSESGWYTPEQEAEICKKYNPNNGDHSFTYWDGKILHVEYKNVAISFQKDKMMFEFIFENIYISFYEDYSYGTGKIYNSSNKTVRYNSIYSGFENLLNIKDISDKPITVVLSNT